VVVRDQRIVLDNHDIHVGSGSGEAGGGGSVSTKPANVASGTTAEIAVHPSGRFVYGINRGHDSIVVFSCRRWRCADA